MPRVSFADRCFFFSSVVDCYLVGCQYTYIHVRSSSCALSVIYWSLTRYRLLATFTCPATSRCECNVIEIAWRVTPPHILIHQPVLLSSYLTYGGVGKNTNTCLNVDNFCCLYAAVLLLAMSARSSWMWCLHAHPKPYEQSSVTNQPTNQLTN
jgi:hypothetical protein